MNRRERRAIQKGLRENLMASAENENAFFYYRTWLESIYLSEYEWEGFDKLGIDARFVELGLLHKNHMLYFNDDVLDQRMCLRCNLTGKRDFADIPTERQAYAINGYHETLTKDNSVIIFANETRVPDYATICFYARKLAEIDRTIDVNVKGQKTPRLITVNSDKEMLTLQNALQQTENNNTAIYVNKSLKDNGSLKPSDITAPYVSDKLYDLKTKIWNEALMRIGVPNTQIEKRERMLEREVINSQGGAIASRFGGLAARQKACLQIKEMFGDDVWVDYRDEFKEGFLTTQLSKDITPADQPQGEETQPRGK